MQNIFNKAKQLIKENAVKAAKAINYEITSFANDAGLALKNSQCKLHIKNGFPPVPAPDENVHWLHKVVFKPEGNILHELIVLPREIWARRVDTTDSLYVFYREDGNIEASIPKNSVDKIEHTALWSRVHEGGKIAIWQP